MREGEGKGEGGLLLIFFFFVFLSLSLSLSLNVKGVQSLWGASGTKVSVMQQVQVTCSKQAPQIRDCLKCWASQATRQSSLCVWRVRGGFFLFWKQNTNLRWRGQAIQNVVDRLFRVVARHVRLWGKVGGQQHEPVACCFFSFFLFAFFFFSFLSFFFFF